MSTSYLVHRIFHIGDPSLLGWLNTLLYLFLVIRAWFKYKQAGEDIRQSRFWLFLLCLFLVLGVNKQLDLHSDVIHVLRMTVVSSSWVAYKEGLKIIAALFCATIFLFSAKAIKSTFSTFVNHYRLLWLGLLMLFFFLFARALAFDHVFSESTQSAAEYYSAFLELPALLMILVGTFIKTSIR